MTTMLVVERLTRVLEQRSDVRLAVLFGSAATGTDRAESDVDVGILSSNDPTGATATALTVALERVLGRTVDLVRLEAAPPLLRFQIAREGRVLVARPPGLGRLPRARND